MPVTAVAILIALTAVAVEALLRPRTARAGWWWFAAWAAAGCLSGLAAVSFAIGLLVLPVALIAIFAVSRVAVWPAVLGFVSGAGVLALLVAALGNGDAGWLVAGIVLAAVPAAALAALHRGR